MKALVTGGAGYIGSHLVKLLRAQNFEITVIDNLSTGSKEALLENELIVLDLADKESLKKLFQEKNFDVIFHFAAKIVVPESIENPALYYQENVKNSLDLIEIAQECGVNNFVFSSTAAVYHDPGLKPVSEDDLVNPLTPYGKSKWMVEEILKDVCRSNNKFKAGILRYFNVAGADPEGEIGSRFPNATHLIKKCLDAALNDQEIKIFGTDFDTKDGTGVRDFIHVTDLANAHIKLLEYLQNSETNFDIFNCGYGAGYSVKEVIKLIEELSQKKLNVIEVARRKGDLGQVICDNSKILDKTNWKPMYNDLRFILKTAYDWQKSLN